MFQSRNNRLLGGNFFEAVTTVARKMLCDTPRFYSVKGFKNQVDIVAKNGQTLIFGTKSRSICKTCVLLAIKYNYTARGVLIVIQTSTLHNPINTWMP